MKITQNVYFGMRMTIPLKQETQEKYKEASAVLKVQRKCKWLSYDAACNSASKRVLTMSTDTLKNYLPAPLSPTKENAIHEEEDVNESFSSPLSGTTLESKDLDLGFLEVIRLKKKKKESNIYINNNLFKSKLL